MGFIWWLGFCILRAGLSIINYYQFEEVPFKLKLRKSSNLHCLLHLPKSAERPNCPFSGLTEWSVKKVRETAWKNVQSNHTKKQFGKCCRNLKLFATIPTASNCSQPFIGLLAPGCEALIFCFFSIKGKEVGHPPAMRRTDIAMKDCFKCSFAET